MLGRESLTLSSAERVPAVDAVGCCCQMLSGSGCRLTVPTSGWTARNILVCAFEDCTPLTERQDGRAHHLRCAQSQTAPIQRLKVGTPTPNFTPRETAHQAPPLLCSHFQYEHLMQLSVSTETGSHGEEEEQTIKCPNT